jgi:DNA-directed RNA polymerase beta' subunit
MKMVSTLDEFHKEYPVITSQKIRSRGDKSRDKFDPNGLHSEVIFGSNKHYSCSCGTLKGEIYKNIKCSNCGVTCNSLDDRINRFGQIDFFKNPVTDKSISVINPVFFDIILKKMNSKLIKSLINNNTVLMFFENPIVYNISKNTTQKLSDFKEEHKESNTFFRLQVHRLSNILNTYVGEDNSNYFIKDDTQEYKFLKEIVSRYGDTVLPEKEYMSFYTNEYELILKCDFKYRGDLELLKNMSSNDTTGNITSEYIKQITKKPVVKNISPYMIKNIDTIKDTMMLLIDTGIFLDLKHLRDYLFVDKVNVFSPEIRPITRLNTKQDTTGEIDSVLSKIINISNKSYTNIFSTSSGQIQRAYTVVPQNNFQKYMNELYDVVEKKFFSEKSSYIRDSFVGRVVEFSGRSVITVDPMLPPYSISLPKRTIMNIGILKFMQKIREWSIALKRGELEDEELKEILKKMPDMNYMKMIMTGFGVSELNKNNIFNNDKFFNMVYEELFHYTSQKDKAYFLIERPPTLYKWNVSGVLLSKIIKDDSFEYIDNTVMGVNTLIREAFNFDFDGDALNIFHLHSEESKKDFNKIFIGSKNTLDFDPNSFLLSFSQESIYSLFSLTTEGLKPWKGKVVEVNTIPEYTVTLKELSNKPHKRVFVKSIGIEVPISFLVIWQTILSSKGTGTQLEDTIVTELKVFGNRDKNELMKNIFDLSLNNIDYQNRVHKLEQLLGVFSTTVQYCIPTFDIDDFIIDKPEITEHKKVTFNEPMLGYNRNHLLFEEIITKHLEKTASDKIMYKLFKSGARLKPIQFSKSSSTSGIPTNTNNEAVRSNIQSSLIEGLTEEDFFILTDGARQALALKETAVPSGGELSRYLFNNLGIIRQSTNEDCGDTEGTLIKVLDKKHLRSLEGKYLMGDDNGSDFPHDYEIKGDEVELVGKTLKMRSVLSCKANNITVCKKCFGSKLKRYKNIGVDTAAFISAGIIQSGLSPHHTSGAYMTKISPKIIEMWKKAKTIENGDTIVFKSKHIAKTQGKIIEEYLYNENSDYSGKDDIDVIIDDNKVKVIQKTEIKNDDGTKILKSIEKIINNKNIDPNITLTQKSYIFKFDNVETLKSETERFRIHWENKLSGDNPEFKLSIHEDDLKLRIIYNKFVITFEEFKKYQNDIITFFKDTSVSEIRKPVDVYSDFIQELLKENMILSGYIESLISLLFYDEDMVNHRYSEKPITQQLSVKEITNTLKPHLSMFYNMNIKSVQSIHLKNVLSKTNGFYDGAKHVLEDWLSIFK